MRLDRRWRRRQRETWEEMRRRLIAETSAYLSECLRHPELAVRIPMAPAGNAEFPPSLTAAFWDPILLD
jgi:hypothetical protein